MKSFLIILNSFPKLNNKFNQSSFNRLRKVKNDKITKYENLDF